MNRFRLEAFAVLLRREMWEHRKLFVGAPLFLVLLIAVAGFWGFVQLGPESVAGTLRQVDRIIQGMPVQQLAPFMLWAGLPFVVLLYVTCLIYLVNTLYQDRKDQSILFWQSMPVSNRETVLSKVVTVCLVAPMATVAILLSFMAFLALGLGLLGVAWGIDFTSYWRAFAAGGLSLLLLYLSLVMSALWLFPSIGWFLLFSAFARNLPLLWAIGTGLLLGMIEDLVFSTQFLANWVQSRSDINQYILFGLDEIPDKLLHYDMFAGIALGILLMVGATYMRRFID